MSSDRQVAVNMSRRTRVECRLGTPILEVPPTTLACLAISVGFKDGTFVFSLDLKMLSALAVLHLSGPLCGLSQHTGAVLELYKLTTGTPRWSSQTPTLSDHSPRPGTFAYRDVV